MALPKQLKMYLGGMRGTGKSQVLKAIAAMFEQKKEIILALTGSAAILLNDLPFGVKYTHLKKRR